MAYHQLTQEERYLISAHLAAGRTQGEIAELLSRSPSTISRELQRNATTHDGRYRPSKAHRYAEARRRRCRRGSRYGEAIYRQVEAALRNYWSPDQIVGHFRAAGVDVPSHETIYRHLRRDKRRGGSLYRHTRIMSKAGRKRYRSRPARGVLLGKPHISNRPRHVERRRQLGHWEGDTVVGKEKTQRILTNVERKSGFGVADKLDVVTADIVHKKTRTRFKRFQKRLRRTLTRDNGTEFGDLDRDLEHHTGMHVYRANPYHSWERGTNENWNGLLRQFFPKGMLFASITQADIDRAVKLINDRPRKRHGYATPREIFTACCDSD